MAVFGCLLNVDHVPLGASGLRVLMIYHSRECSAFLVLYHGQAPFGIGLRDRSSHHGCSLECP